MAVIKNNAVTLLARYTTPQLLCAHIEMLLLKQTLSTPDIEPPVLMINIPKRLNDRFFTAINDANIKDKTKLICMILFRKVLFYCENSLTEDRKCSHIFTHERFKKIFEENIAAISNHPEFISEFKTFCKTACIPTYNDETRVKGDLRLIIESYLGKLLQYNTALDNWLLQFVLQDYGYETLSYYRLKNKQIDYLCDYITEHRCILLALVCSLPAELLTESYNSNESDNNHIYIKADSIIERDTFIKSDTFIRTQTSGYTTLGCTEQETLYAHPLFFYFIYHSHTATNINNHMYLQKIMESPWYTDTFKWDIYQIAACRFTLSTYNAPLKNIKITANLMLNNTNIQISPNIQIKMYGYIHTRLSEILTEEGLKYIEKFYTR